MEEDSLSLDIEGLNLDALYERFVWQVAGERLSTSIPCVELKETIAKSKEVQKIEQQITQLETLPPQREII